MQGSSGGLMKKGEDVKAQDDERQFTYLCFHVVCQEGTQGGSAPIPEVAKGADVNAQDEKGMNTSLLGSREWDTRR